jgi:hypothetical protein
VDVPRGCRVSAQDVVRPGFLSLPGGPKLTAAAAHQISQFFCPNYARQRATKPLKVMKSLGRKCYSNSVKIGIFRSPDGRDFRGRFAFHEYHIW